MAGAGTLLVRTCYLRAEEAPQAGHCVIVRSAAAHPPGPLRVIASHSNLAPHMGHIRVNASQSALTADVAKPVARIPKKTIFVTLPARDVETLVRTHLGLGPDLRYGPAGFRMPS